MPWRPRFLILRENKEVALKMAGCLPLEERLSVILTTSPASDHPHTELLEQVIVKERCGQRFSLNVFECDLRS